MKNKTSSQQISMKNMLLGRPPAEYKERYRQERVRTNISRMFALSVYIIVIQIVLNIINIFKPEDTKNTDVSIYVFLSLITLGIGVIYLVLSLLCRKNVIKNSTVQYALPFTLLYLYGAIQMTFFTLNIQADTGGINSYVIALIIISFGFVIKPVWNIFNVLVSIAYVFCAMYLQQGKSDVWGSVMLTDTWANLIIITALVLVMSIWMYQMYMSDFISKMRLEESIEQANRLARVDSLTGLLNRRGFFELLDEKWPGFKTEKKLITMTMFDIDFFKAYNDYFGHLAGDDCLYNVATTLRDYFEKQGGLLCRFGGEEFLAFVNPVNPEEAKRMVEDARKLIDGLGIEGVPTVSSTPNVTVSAGFITAETTELLDYEELINRADIALYQSKRSGRNISIEYSDGIGAAMASHVRMKKHGENGYNGAEKRGKNDL